MEIRHRDVCIRNAETKDCAQLAAWWNDGRVMAHAGFPLGLHTTAEEIARSIAADSDGTRRRLILEYRGRAVGEMCARNLGGGSAGIGIKICEPAYRERGLGRVALSLLIRELFRSGYERIVLDTNTKNTRAQHVYELLGFEKLRVNENSWRDQLGAPQSSVDYALTPERFHEGKKKKKALRPALPPPPAGIKEGKRMENEMLEQGEIKTTYLKLATPTAINMIIVIVYSMADTFFVSQLQNADMVAGVSLCAPILILLMAMGNFLTQGGCCLVSRLVGERNYDGIRRATSFCFYGTVGIGLLAALILLAGRGPILRLIGVTAETYGDTVPYYSSLAVGAPLICLSFLHSNLMRGEGYTKDNMYATLLGALVNIALDPLLILVWKLGTLGAGIATVVGYAATCVYSLAVIPRRNVHISMKPALARIPREYAKDILGVGLSSLSLNLMSSVSMIVLNNFMVPYGNDKVAAMGIAMKLSNIAFFALDGYAYGAQPPAGYYFGAKRFDDLRELLRFVFLFLFGLGAALSVLTAIFARQLGGLFLKDPEIVASAALMLRILLLTIPLVGLELLITVLFQAFGRAREALILSFARTGYVFLPVILLLSRVWGYHGVIAAQAVTDAVSMAVAAGMFLPYLKKLK